MKYLTAQPGIGGVIKRDFEDFSVEEIPLFSPAGVGEHTFFEIEKRGATTLDAASRIAEALGVSPYAVGFAGMKDSRATARQWMSVWKVAPERTMALDIPNIRVLRAVLHNQKLKLGQLSGNRFRITVREVGRDALEKSEAIMSILAKRGVPNYFGEQRFGSTGSNHLIGRALLNGDAMLAIRIFAGAHGADIAGLIDKGDFLGACGKLSHRLGYERACLQMLAAGKTPESAMMAIPKKLRGLFVSAYHSHLFNAILERRIDTIDRLFEGDLAVFGFRGGRYFRVEEVDEKLEERLSKFEISPSGPVPGCKVELASGFPGSIEREVLSGIDFSKRLPGFFCGSRGTRRPLRFPLSGLHIGFKEPDALELQFTLPMGCYATAVLREVMKNAEGKREETNAGSRSGDTGRPDSAALSAV